MSLWLKFLLVGLRKWQEGPVLQTFVEGIQIIYNVLSANCKNREKKSIDSKLREREGLVCKFNPR